MFADLHTAWRSLRRAPGLVVAAVFTIALGVAANAVAFAWFKGIALDPLPGVRDAGALVRVGTHFAKQQGAPSSIAYPDYRDWRTQATSVDGIAVYSMDQFGLRTAGPDAPGATQEVWGNYASAEFFTTLGVRPTLGRFWRPDEAATPGGAPVVVLSDALWRARFAADPSTVGRTLWVNGVPCTVIGVAPRGFAGAFVGLRFDLWVPVTMWPRLADWKEKLDRRESQWLQGFARPRPGMSLPQVNAELATIGARVSAEHPEAVAHVPVGEPFANGDAQQILRPLFGVLLAASALVQVVVCANVANLLLARAAARSRELGVRSALGATRGRLVRGLAGEGALLAAAGGALGVLAATGARALLGVLIPPVGLPVAFNAGVDWRVLLVSAVLAAGTALLAGVAPAVRATRTPRAARGTDPLALAQGARGGTRAEGGTLRGLVVVQLALALVALVGAGLFARSLAALGRVDLGFRDPERVLVAYTDLTLAGRTSNAAGRALLDRWVDRVRAMPDVEAATVSDFVPLGLGGNSNFNSFVPTGYVVAPGQPNGALFNAVGDDYFRTIGVRLVGGRLFDARDRAGAPRVAIVNEAYARHFFAGRDPVGATAGYGTTGADSSVRIVGVVRDGHSKMDDLTGAPPPFVYTPLAQRPNSAVYLQVRVRRGTDPLSLFPRVRRALADVEPAMPLSMPQTLARWSASATFVQRLGASVMAVLGAVALTLAAVGLYAVTAYAVARRTREIGVRVALGATAARTLAGVLGDGGRTAGVGLAAGAVVAFAAARLLSAQLYGVSPADPATFVGAAALLLAVALAAAWVPARRAARVNPTEALRAE